MKYCKNCGAQLEDEAVICPGCGCATDAAPAAAVAAPAEPSTLQTIAKVFMILGCIAGAFCFLIPLAWMIPMTIHYSNAIKENRPVGIGFKICAFLFVNMIAGILMLCDTKN